jgi:hypothetical protein
LSTTRALTVTGPHPYDGTVTEATVTVDLHAALPGAAMEARDLRRSKTAAVKAEGWQILAGPYQIEPGRYAGAPWAIGETSATLERWALLGLLWDLTGQPFRNGGLKRKAARIAVVEEPEGICVYRDVRECIDCDVMREMRRGEEPDVVGQWADLRFSNSGPRRLVAGGDR